MKKDQYIPHDVSMRNNSQVIHLIETEGAAGYGFFWAVMEYLRTQDDYVGDIRAVRTIARQMKTSITKALRILNEYNLFVVGDFTFHSPKLNERMRPLDRKRAVYDAYKQRKEDEILSQNADKPLEINRGVDAVKKESSEVQVQEPVQVKVSSSTKEEKKVGDDDVCSVPSWEQHVDALASEEQWKELMAMRSGMKGVFLKRFDEILRCFKMHVKAVANERSILSPSDAKRYFCFYITPGSATYMRLMEQLRTTQPSASPYEQCDPDTGQRSYCGVSIPANAPPRPNAQAVWDGEEWKY